jgi:hypothetical protein
VRRTREKFGVQVQGGTEVQRSEAGNAQGMRTRILLGLLLAAVALSLAPSAATAASFTSATDCREHQAFVEGDEAAVAARLPDHYTPLREPSSGRPLVFARALRCQAMTLDGRAAPVTLSSYGVVIESPDGKGCGSGGPGAGTMDGDNPPICNWYTLAWYADDRRVVDWLREGTPNVPASYVPEQEFELGAFDPAGGGAPFRFQVPAPAASPFTIDATVREGSGELSVRGGYWMDTPQGTVKVAVSTDDLSSGDATGTVRAAPGSELWALLGADERPHAAGYSNFAALKIGHGSYRKQLLFDSPNADSFAGTCSLQGDVTFDPPATNTPTPLTYTYDAAGTCTGTVNGREVEDAPVDLHQSGRADGACTRAHTTSPGVGTMKFADGTTIRYTLDFSFVATEGTAELYGDRSGYARAQATFATQRTPNDVALQCAGAGAEVVPMDAKFTTETPLVSDRPGGGPGPKPADGRKPLRLAVTPRAVRAGRRTAFQFRVTTAQGRPVARARIRFAGRRLRTNRAGRARVTTTLRRAGRHRARATKRGFRPARVTVRARRGR